MLYIQCVGQQYDYDISQLLNLFIEQEEYEFIEENKKTLDDFQGYFLLCKLSTLENSRDICIQLTLAGKTVGEVCDSVFELEDEEPKIFERRIKRNLLKSIHETMSIEFESKSPWGILVGVRPVKVVHEMLDNNLRESAIINELTNQFRIRKDKAHLLIKVAKSERTFIFPVKKELFSIYISIPFCPSRCLYCSFPSNYGKEKLKYREKYVETLIYEIESVSKALATKKLETLYIGGGTPTTLEAHQLERIINTIKENFNVSELKEITVEAGRPDTINEDKLKTLKKCGVERICINPQTMNDDTITLIGRKHSAKDIEDSFYLARKIGFKTINMDLILGLPGETIESLKNTLDWIQKFKPENVTIHTLAIKKHADLRHKINEYPITEENILNEMIDYSSHTMSKMHLEPYYMYRQKYMTGNLENVGYALAGHESIYNIQMMEEKQNILAFGAGAVSKMCYPDEDRFERVPNIKGLAEYLERVDEMIQRKMKFLLD